MLIDLHTHSSGISTCCRIPYDAVIRAALHVGLDGIVLTNHYSKSYVADGDYAAFAKEYTKEFHLARAFGETVGCKVFFGVEVTMEYYDRVHVLVYGIEERFLEENPTLFDFTLEELYQRVKAVGGTVVQAHPYRKQPRLLDTRYLDGVEVNCHPKYGTSNFEEVLAVAKRDGLILTCGGDYHADTAYRPRCGVYLPDDIADSVALGKYLLAADALTLCIHEPNAAASFDYCHVHGA